MRRFGAVCCRWHVVVLGVLFACSLMSLFCLDLKLISTCVVLARSTLDSSSPFLRMDFSFCLCIYLSINLSVYLSIDRSIYRSIDLSIYRSIDLSIDLSIYRSIDLSDLSIYLSIYLPIDLSIGSIDLSIYLILS